MNKTNIYLGIALVLILGAIFAISQFKPTAPDPEDSTIDIGGGVMTGPSGDEPEEETIRGAMTGNAPEKMQDNATDTPRQNQPTQESLISEEAKMRIAEKNKIHPAAKELVKPHGYINTPRNLTIKDNIGKKVILVDFWTYSCINCQRTLPYLNDWQDKYSDQGLLIIGVHTPEFSFEKKIENVEEAVEKYDVEYPVILDNDYLTWRAYENRYWPRKYLIDIDGFIVYDHIGEGAYKQTESKIIELLKERRDVLKQEEELRLEETQANGTSVQFARIKTPELYFGYEFEREGQFGNDEGRTPEEIVSYKMPSRLVDNKFYLSGMWENNPDNMESVGAGMIALDYEAKQVNLVAGAMQSTTIKIFIDGKETGELEIKEFDLYELYTAEDYGRHNIRIETESGLMAYTFTFG